MPMRWKPPLQALMLGAVLACKASSGPPSLPAGEPPAAGAPPRRCLLTRPAWCIDEEVAEVATRTEQGAGNQRSWVLSGASRPDSKLVVLEPSGCADGPANTFEFLAADRHANWGGRPWRSVTARLRKDGSCDLTVLVPPPDPDPMEWALSTGLVMVRACEGAACQGRNFGDFRNHLAK
jgi:hypothetical protein